jgi:hypothetical protein
MKSLPTKTHKTIMFRFCLIGDKYDLDDDVHLSNFKASTDDPCCMFRWFCIKM